MRRDAGCGHHVDATDADDSDDPDDDAPRLVLADALQERLGAPRGKQSLSTFLRKTLVLAPAGIGLLHEATVASPQRPATVTPAVLAMGQRMMSWARFDYAVMLVIIADMVLKPTLHDIGILAGMALVAAAGAALALGGSRQLVPSAA